METNSLQYVLNISMRVSAEIAPARAVLAGFESRVRFRCPLYELLAILPSNVEVTIKPVIIQNRLRCFS